VKFNVEEIATGKVVGEIITGADGFSTTIELIIGVQYRLVETFAPPSLDAYLPRPGGPQTFNMQKDGYNLDMRNVLKPA
jgi:hypothetical protein